MRLIKNSIAMNYKKFVTLLLLALFFTSALTAQVYTRKISKSYKVNSSTTIDIFNKYGKVHVVTWDKDSVKFNINLTIQTSNESKLTKLKQNIGFDFTGTDYYVIAKTRLGKKSGVFTELLDIAGTLISSDNKVTIDYLVYIPLYANINIENKFGDIYTDDLEGSVNINLSNGDLKANDLNGNSVISLSSGDGVINYMRDGRITVSYSDLTVKTANKLHIDSRSSKIYIDKADYLKLISRRDRLYFQIINDLYGDSYFSDFTLHRLNNELNYNFKYGNLSIALINRYFSFININSEYTDLDLIFEKGSAYIIDILHHQDVILNIPAHLSKIEQKVIDEDDQLLSTYGTIGYGNPASKVKINVPKKCIVNIVHK
jgi:hypothetical protein